MLLHVVTLLIAQGVLLSLGCTFGGGVAFSPAGESGLDQSCCKESNRAYYATSQHEKVAATTLLPFLPVPATILIQELPLCCVAGLSSILSSSSGALYNVCASLWQVNPLVNRSVVFSYVPACILACL